jgi:TAG lipase/lysophosphatidylethanolamine acyltransferase
MSNGVSNGAAGWSIAGILKGVWSCFFEVAFFWQLVRLIRSYTSHHTPAARAHYDGIMRPSADILGLLKRLYSWWTKPSTQDVLLEAIAEANIFEEWEANAFQLDEVLAYDLWYFWLLPSFHFC